MTSIATTETPSLWSRFLMQFRSDDVMGTAWGAVTVFLMPALLMYAAFTAYPVIRTFYNSLHIVRPGRREEFVGFDHFIELLTNDEIFLQAVIKICICSGIDAGGIDNLLQPANIVINILNKNLSFIFFSQSIVE